MIVSGAWCFKCKTFNYSRAVHDFHACPCGSLHVDGGRDYLKLSYYDSASVGIETREINATAEELYKDWNAQKNKFGTTKWKGTDEEFEAVKAKILLSQTSQTQT